MTIAYTIVTLAAIGLVFAVVLYFVATKFKVEEDPLIDEVEKLLPGANCGGCGRAGCRAFAESVVKDKSLLGGYCTVGGNEVMARIAGVLGVSVEARAPMAAVVRCAGSSDKCPRTNVYDGYASCKVASALYAGDTGCKWGCIGLGDCVSACSFSGIKVDPVRRVAEIDSSRCTGCGSCVRACPRGVIELRTKGAGGRMVSVLCLNRDKGAVTRKACSVGCIGCRKCEKACPFGAISVEDNVAYIDHTKCRFCRKCVAECPVGAISAVNFPIAVVKD